MVWLNCPVTPSSFVLFLIYFMLCISEYRCLVVSLNSHPIRRSTAWLCGNEVNHFTEKMNVPGGVTSEGASVLACTMKQNCGRILKGSCKLIWQKCAAVFCAQSLVQPVLSITSLPWWMSVWHLLKGKPSKKNYNVFFQFI